MNCKHLTLLKFLPAVLGVCLSSEAFSNSGKYGTTSAQNTNAKQLQSPTHQIMEMFNSRSPSSFYVTSDFTYWIAIEDGLEYALNGIQAFDEDTSLTGVGNTFTPNFQWDPGFKVGMGYTDPSYAWDLFVGWTWYRTVANASVNTDVSSFSNNDLIWAQFDIARYGIPSGQDASSKWSLHYNTLDFAIGRNFCIGKHLGFKPFTGLRAAWIGQKYNVHNIGLNLFPPNPNEDRVKNNLHYTGVGFRGGCSTSWYFNKHFSFFSDASLSVLYGHLTDQFKILRSAAFNISENQIVAHLENSTYSMKSEIEVGVGFRYETYYGKNQHFFALNVAWEYLNWINMNQFYIPVTGTDPFPQGPGKNYQKSGQFQRLNGDLGMTGFTLCAEFGF